MNYLLFFIILYILGTLLIGFFAGRLVKNTQDYVLAGRSIPLIINASAFFATWFGAETVLGASSEFLEHGLLGVIEDPFGAALCLLLVGAFFARPLYKMNILSLGDFFRIRYGSRVELFASIFLIVSYFSWTAAQFVAFGVILNTIAGIPVIWGSLIGMIIVVGYTYVGGMWAISLTDFVQTGVIIIGLSVLAYSMLGEAGGLKNVYEKTPTGFFNFFPEPDFDHIILYLVAWITVGLGSIPSQDIFQRLMSAKSVKVAVRATYLGSMMYLTIAFLPLLIALCAKVAYPENIDEVGQNAIPMIVLQHSSLFIQILFFGALLSAIMSSASAAILAPATILGENIIKPHMKNLSEAKFLLLLRVSVIIIAIVSFFLTLIKDNVYELVAQSSAIALVSLFVPLTAGIYLKMTNKWGAILSMLMGLCIWLIYSFLYNEAIAIILGLFASITGLILGIILNIMIQGLKYSYVDK